MKRNIFFIIVFSLFTSCCFFPVKEQNTVPDYKPDVNWKLETRNHYGEYIGSQYGRYYYSLESYEGIRIAKIDLEDGSVKWLSDTDVYSVSSEPVVCGDYVFLPSTWYRKEAVKNKIYCFSNDTGKLCATIKLTDSEEWTVIEDIYPFSYNLYGYKDKYIYWNNCAMNKTCKSAIYKIDISNIDFTKEADEIQIIEPEIFIDNKRLWTYFIENDNILYVRSDAALRYEEGPTTFYAYNAETGEQIWEYTTDKIRGWALNPLLYVNDEKNGIKNKLFCIAEQLGCYDASTGEPVWEIFQTDEDLQKEHHLGGFDEDTGIFYSDGRLYYTTYDTCNSTEYPKHLRNNILCIDAKTGKYIWSYATDGSLGSRPIVSNGKVFVTTFLRGLYVFDAKTGKLIGSDKTKGTWGDERNAIYNGNVIFFDYSKKNGTLYSIKP